MDGAKKIYSVISKIQEELSTLGISKTKQNTQQGFKFRGIDDVLNTLSPLLAKHKLCILPRCTERQAVERQSARGGILLYVTVKVEYDFVAEDGSSHTVITYGEAMDSGDKATNKAMSAAYKYAAFQTFCIPTEETSLDADLVTHELAAAPTYSKKDVLADIKKAESVDSFAELLNKYALTNPPEKDFKEVRETAKTLYKKAQAPEAAET